MKLQTNKFKANDPNKYLKFDKPEQRYIALEFARRLAAFFADKQKVGIISSGFRDVELQRKLYEENCRQYPPNGNGYVAKPGSSWHNGRCAVDISDDGFWKKYMENGDMKKTVKQQELYKHGLCLPLNYVDSKQIHEWWHLQPVEVLGYSGDRVNFLDSDDEIFNLKNERNDFVELKNGSTGDEVKELQNSLNYFGYKLAVDGIYGKLSEGAVKDYQSKNGLKVTGIADFYTQIDIQRKIVSDLLKKNEEANKEKQNLINKINQAASILKI